MTEEPNRILPLSELNRLITALARRDYEVIGPVIRDGAIVYDHVRGIEDLPAGWKDEQAPGRYRLKERADDALFGYAQGPQSLKKYLHPASIRLWSAERENQTFHILDQEPRPAKRYAFIGVRSCDLVALGIQDRVLLEDRYQDPIYAQRRDGIFIVAVNCIHSASTCFCVSMGSGPNVRSEYDLALTELVGTGEHRFRVSVGSRAGHEVLAELTSREASEEDEHLAQAAVDSAAASQTRRLDTAGIRELLYSSFEHPEWENVANRCLACTNCTAVCPTCFCTTVHDTSDLSGNHAERWRLMDSCFSLDFSYVHGGSVRTTTKARYRQWLTHKLASWIDQFGSSGCVGCGRCIAWCPVGIDITEEMRIIRGTATDGNT